MGAALPFPEFVWLFRSSELIDELHKYDAALDCIVFDCCHSEEITEAVMQSRRARYIIYWKSASATVNSEVARCFARAFYESLRQLGSGRVVDNRAAFEHARSTVQRLCQEADAMPMMLPAEEVPNLEIGIPLN